MTPPSQYSRIMVLQPLAAFDVGDRTGEEADDHDQKQQVHHERPSWIPASTRRLPRMRESSRHATARRVMGARLSSGRGGGALHSEGIRSFTVKDSRTGWACPQTLGRPFALQAALAICRKTGGYSHKCPLST